MVRIATTQEIHDVFPEFDGPITDEVLSLIMNLSEVLWESDEHWNYLNKTNSKQLKELGYEGEVLDFSRYDAE